MSNKLLVLDAVVSVIYGVARITILMQCLSIEISHRSTLHLLIIVELKTEKKIRELDDVIKRSLAVSTKVSLLVMRADKGKLIIY